MPKRRDEPNGSAVIMHRRRRSPRTAQRVKHHASTNSVYELSHRVRRIHGQQVVVRRFSAPRSPDSCEPFKVEPGELFWANPEEYPSPNAIGAYLNPWHTI